MKMAKFKIWMVALTLITGVSLTSCLDSGESNPIQQQTVLAKLTMGSTYSNVLIMQGGIELVPSDPTSLMLLNAGMYMVDIQYNVNDVQANSKTLNVTLLSTPTKIDGPYVTTTTPIADAPMYVIKYEDNGGIIAPYFFDKNTLIFPALYWYKASTGDERTAEIKKHSFVLSYDEIEEGDETLTLKVTHLISEDKKAERKSYIVSYFAYDLKDAIEEFTSKGNTLKKIVLSAKSNTSSNKLEDAKDETYEMDYTKIAE